MLAEIIWKRLIESENGNFYSISMSEIKWKKAINDNGNISNENEYVKCNMYKRKRQWKKMIIVMAKAEMKMAIIIEKYEK